MLSDYLYKTEEYRGYTINVYYDTDSQSPREWDNLGTIYSNSRSYDPDKHSIDEILNDEGTGLSDEFKKNYIWLKIRGYEHSGLTISCEGGYPYNDPWDSGLFGIIAVSKADAIKEYGKKKLSIVFVVRLKPSICTTLETFTDSSWKILMAM